MLYFAAFRVDSVDGRMWHGDDQIPLRPKTAGVLRCLLSRPGEVVSKQALLADVWPDGFVGDAVLSVCVNELRNVLGDQSRRPRFIATVPRRGFQFVAPVSTGPLALDAPMGQVFVGRAHEIAMLRSSWQLARGGDRQMVFVDAPAGVGKSTLTDVFAREVHAEEDAAVGFGQCAEQFGEGEAYLPVLDALVALGRGPDSRRVLAVLRSVAPTWLLQLPGLLEPADLSALAAHTLGVTPARMLREMAVALAELTVTRPLLLVLEDLQHSDRPTTELLAYVARGREPARLMIVGTYRPTEVVVRNHPLRQVVRDLNPRGLCRAISLELLPRSALAEYLAVRLAPARPSAQLVDDVHQRTDGNALFVTRLIDHLMARDLLVNVDGEVHARAPLDELGIPESVRQFVERQLAELDAEDRLLLEVASAIGVEFASEAVLAAARHERPDLTTVEVEDRCARLASESTLLTGGVLVRWPDGTLTTNYGFHHALFQQVLYSGLSPARRVNIHRRIGDRLVSAYGSGEAVTAAELAMHFERGQDHEQAVRYLADAASIELQRAAFREALAYTERGLQLIERTPTLDDRATELRLRRRHLVTIGWLRGFSDPSVESEYFELRDICSRIDDVKLLDSVLFWLWAFAINERSVDDAAELTEKFAELARRDPTPRRALEAHFTAGFGAYAAGRLTAALPHLESGLELYESAGHGRLTLRYGHDLGISQHRWGGFAVWLLGYADRAREHTRRARRLADDLGYPLEIARTASFGAAIHVLCGDVERVRQLSKTLLEVSEAYDLALFSSAAKVYDGWALVHLGEHERGVRLARDGHAMNRPGQRRDRPVSDSLVAANLHFLTWILADALAASGDDEGAMDSAREALGLARQTGHRWLEAEEVRLLGDLFLSRGSAAEGERAYLEAHAIAQQQQAKSLELRAATSLARLWHARGETKRARELLAPTYGWFTEGHDTRDLSVACDLLTELGD